VRWKCPGTDSHVRFGQTGVVKAAGKACKDRERSRGRLLRLTRFITFRVNWVRLTRRNRYRFRLHNCPHCPSRRDLLNWSKTNFFFEKLVSGQSIGLGSVKLEQKGNDGERGEDDMDAATGPGSGKHPWRTRCLATEYDASSHFGKTPKCRMEGGLIKGKSGKGKAGQGAGYCIVAL